MGVIDPQLTEKEIAEVDIANKEKITKTTADSKYRK